MSKIVTMSFYFMICLLVLVLVQLGSAGISWALNLAVGSDGEFQRPSKKQANDWVSFDQLGVVANEIINNHKRLSELKEKLEHNTYQDAVVKFSGLGFLVLSTIYAIFSRIQSVKRVVRGEQAQPGYPMVNPVRVNQDVFGRASF